MPVIATLEIFKVMLPVLLRVTVRGALVCSYGLASKGQALVERPATGEVPTPVPVRGIICGLPLALSVMATEAARLPAELGVNVTLIVQLLPAATEAPQVLVSVKSPGLAPARDTGADVQRRIARIVQSYGLRGARRSEVLITEG